ncbi:MAG: cytochrome c [bacterium]|jgi:mono/diheme cytochrome c family protein
MLPDPVKKWLLPVLAAGFVLSWIPLSLIAMQRTGMHKKPRFELIQDMDWQPYFRSQMENPAFADGRAMRPRVPGTVARSEAILNNEHFTRGLVRDEFFTGGKTWATTYPIRINMQTLERGKERYGIYCAPCHGYAGYGDGPVAVRAEQLQQGTWTPPSSFHSDLVRSRPVGHIFNTITNGIRNMPAYGPQISPHDRWAIVAYVKALQLSQHAKADILAPEERRKLGLGTDAPKPADESTGGDSAAPGARKIEGEEE